MSVLVIIAVLIAFYPYISVLNFRRNSALDDDALTSSRNRLLNDQNGETGKLFRFGLYAARRNACEAIALHDLRVLCGMESSLSQAIRDIQKSAAMIGYGFLGTNPFALGRVMRKHGFEVVRISEADMPGKGLYIFSFWTKKPWLSPAHTVAVKSDGQKLIAYNLLGTGYPSRLRPEQYAGRILCVYRIKKL